MKLKSQILAVAISISIFIFSGCAHSEEGFKKLGEDVVMALQSKNSEAYLNFCLTDKDKKYLIALSDLTSAEKKAQTALISTSSRDMYKARESKIINFNDISSSEEWDSVTVHKFILGKRINSNGIVCYENIAVKFKKKILPDLLIGKVVKVKDVWKIMDAQALSFKSRI